MDNGRMKRILVKTGISDGSYSEFISGGLKEGSEVITESSDSVKASAKSNDKHVGPPPMM